MSIFADSSALVKLYADEPGYEQVQRLPAPLLISVLARVEVAAALWRKHRTGALDLDDVLLLTRDFAADYGGTPDVTPRFQTVQLDGHAIEHAAELVGTHGLRAYDAIQLASALAIRAVDKGCDMLASFDHDLNRAAVAEGFEVLPPSPAPKGM